MKTSRPIFALPATLGWLCLAVAFCPARSHAQGTQPPRNRPAARPTASPARAGARSAATPAPRPSPTPEIIPSAPADPEAAELTPPSDTADAAPIIQTEIDATDGATFASKERIAVFSGNVRVIDPRFQLACDKLTVFLNKSATPDSGTALPPQGPAAGSGTPAPLAPGNTPPPPDAKGKAVPGNAAPGAAPGGGGGIDHAKAEGHVIIIQKRAATKPGEEEKVSYGRGDIATFDNKTGDMVLYGMPSIEQNGNSHSATSPDTVMTIHKDSSLDTKGPNQTTLIQRKGGNTGIELPGVPSTPASGAGGKKKNKGNGATAPAAPTTGGTQGNGTPSR